MPCLRYYVHCTLYTINNVTIHTLNCYRLYIKHLTLNTVHCATVRTTIYNVHLYNWNVNSTMYTVHFNTILYTVHFNTILCTLHCTLKQSTLYSVHSPMILAWTMASLHSSLYAWVSLLIIILLDRLTLTKYTNASHRSISQRI